ncbi:MAG: patatin-like phospholipase family protein [Candidatus Omnitrophica bacterium]|nr:patatin-like phospholipase family protein [Candidatus Omnitrophota bacterium]
MGLFSFGRKLEVSKGYAFSEIPLFSSLSPAEIRLIEKKIRHVECRRGDIVYHEGKPADAFYVIVSGRFRVFQKVRGEEEKTLIYLYRGDYFGESSLLTDQSHSASVEARSDGLLLKLEKADFMSTLSEIPSLSLHLSRTLGHRLTKIEGAGRKKQEVKVAALYSVLPATESFQFLYDLATNLVRETKSRVVFIDFLAFESGSSHNLQSRPRSRLSLAKIDPAQESELKPALVDCPAGFQYVSVEAEKGEGGEKKLASFLTFLTYRFDYLLIRLGNGSGDASWKILKHSDTVYCLIDPSPSILSGSAPVIHEIEKTYGFAKNEIKVIFPEPADSQAINYESTEQSLGLKVFHALPSRNREPERYHAALRFISKELAGTLLGLVLGSGAAYGLAHIGVLRTLEKENIPVDILAGSSMGALVAAFWAAGYRASDLEKIAQSLNRHHAFFKLVGFRDLSLPHHGFFHGRQVARFMESYLGNRTFQDLRVPVKIVASSLTTSQPVVFESGRVVDALRASISIPGIFRPCHYRGELLIDGGILDPMPIDALAKMGVKKIIAVNVLCGPDDRVQKSRFLAERRKEFFRKRPQDGFLKRFLRSLSEKTSRYFSGNIFNVIMSTIQFMEYEIAQVSSQEADVLIRPVAPEGHWAEFYRSEKFIREGEKRTAEQMEEIKRLLVE